MLAREAAFCTFVDYYSARFGELPPDEDMNEMAEIISWNLWQMDGLRGVVPGSCHDGEKRTEEDLFGVTEQIINCSGCRNGDIMSHNGIYCLIRDWGLRGRKEKRFVDLIRR